MENTKRDLSLDFTKPRQPRGGQSGPSLMTPTIYNISTPDISTPDLNKLISDGELAVLTPNGISSIIPQTTVLPSPLIPTTVNSNNIINANNNNNNNSNTNGTGNGNQNGHCVSTKNYNSNNLQNSNKCNGITNNNGNQQNQSSHKKRSDKNREVDVERIEKKRERNRLAAKKCRQRKLETIDELRKTVSEWEQKYQRLEVAFDDFKKIRNREIEALMREIAELKQGSNLIARRS